MLDENPAAGARIAAVAGYWKDLDPRLSLEFATGLLHMQSPAQHWLWTRWMWDPARKTGILPLMTGGLHHLQASDLAHEDGIYANVINVTSADRLFRDYFRASQCGVASYLDELLPVSDRHVPAITLLDGHPLTLAWLGTIFSAPVKPLGVANFGEVGAVQDLYHKHHIDVDAILTALVQVLFGQS